MKVSGLDGCSEEKAWLEEDMESQNSLADTY